MIALKLKCFVPYLTRIFFFFVVCLCVTVSHSGAQASLGLIISLTIASQVELKVCTTTAASKYMWHTKHVSYNI